MKLRIRQEREDHDWNQQYVAEYAGITKQSISAIENGEAKPSYEVLVKLEDLYGLTHRELFAAVPDNTITLYCK